MDSLFLFVHMWIKRCTVSWCILNKEIINQFLTFSRASPSLENTTISFPIAFTCQQHFYLCIFRLSLSFSPPCPPFNPLLQIHWKTTEPDPYAGWPLRKHMQPLFKQRLHATPHDPAWTADCSRVSTGVAPQNVNIHALRLFPITLSGKRE